MKFLENIFSIKNDDCYKIYNICGIKLKVKNFKRITEKQFFELYLTLNAQKNNKFKDATVLNGCAIIDIWSKVPNNLKSIFPNIEFLDFNQENLIKAKKYFIWGTHFKQKRYQILQQAINFNRPIYTCETGFLWAADTFENIACDSKYRTGISYVIDSVVPYYDARYASNLEQMINDPNYIVTEEQKQRARKCIDKIVETHITKYNHQPIFEPKIGREGVKKVLVVDQSYGDMSITRGWGCEDTFKTMLECAIKENPDADIIVKTHPDAMVGLRGGYYTGLKPHDNVYTQTEPINPISLLKYVDKVYVCSTQFGFEALLCNKEVRVFGMPFYAGWGLTQDEQICERRTNKRSLEEIFYLTYIVYSHYVNPETKQVCEIEEAMDYLLKLREEYNQLYNEGKS